MKLKILESSKRKLSAKRFKWNKRQQQNSKRKKPPKLNELGSNRKKRRSYNTRRQMRTRIV